MSSGLEFRNRGSSIQLGELASIFAVRNSGEQQAACRSMFRHLNSSGPLWTTRLGPLCNSSGVVLLQPGQLGFGRQLDGLWSSHVFRQGWHQNPPPTGQPRIVSKVADSFWDSPDAQGRAEPDLPAPPLAALLAPPGHIPLLLAMMPRNPEASFAVWCAGAQGPMHIPLEGPPVLRRPPRQHSPFCHKRQTHSG